MAEHHYTFHLVERKSLEELSSMNTVIKDHSFDEVPYWIYSHKQKS